MSLVLWVDSDANVQAWEETFREAGFELLFMSEVEKLLNFYELNQDKVTAICTSTMRRGGRQERGLPDAFQLADRVVALCGNLSYKPLLAFITASAEEQVVLEHGFSIYQHGNRRMFVHKVIELLTTSRNRDFRMSREVNKCGLEMLSYCLAALVAAHALISIALRSLQPFTMHLAICAFAHDVSLKRPCNEVGRHTRCLQVGWASTRLAAEPQCHRELAGGLSRLFPSVSALDSSRAKTYVSRRYAAKWHQTASQTKQLLGRSYG